MPHNQGRLRAGITVVIAVCNIGTGIAGSFTFPSSAPVGRLAANVRKYTEEHPQDPNGFFVLGRIHALAFCNGYTRLDYWGSSDGNALPDIEDSSFEEIIFSTFGGKRAVSQPPRTRAQAGHFLTESVRNYSKAVTLDPSPARYHLALAYVLDVGADYAGEADVLPPANRPPAASQSARFDSLLLDLISTDDQKRKRADSDFRENLVAASACLFEHRASSNPGLRHAVLRMLAQYWRDRALESYTAAYDRSVRLDHQEAVGGRVYDRPVSREAGEAIIRLVHSRGVCDDADRARLRAIEEHIKVIDDNTGIVLSPVIFSVESNCTLDELLAAGSSVCFDLDGDTHDEYWPWVRPDTAFLVWDPQAASEIRSGRDLFGSVTWWLFFRDGYHAMDGLDDNRDGWLSGTELSGLALWFDRNSNGFSDAGEVVPILKSGIDAISVHATAKVGLSPANPAGLLMSDGRVLPTYDWMTARVPDADRSPAVASASPREP